MIRQKIPKIPEDANYDLRISTGQKEFFVNRNPRGLVIGPCDQELKSGKDDHLTIGETEDGKLQVHRTIDKRKAWWHTEESIQAEFSKFWIGHSIEMDSSLLHEPNTVVISLRRILVVFSLLNLVTLIGMALFGRLFAKIEVVQQIDRSYRIMLRIDKERMVQVMGAIMRPVAMFFKMFSLVPNQVKTTMLRNLSRLFLIRPENADRLTDNLGILVSSGKTGLVKMTKKRTLAFIPFSALGELYGNIEKSVPFGKFSELGYFGERTTLELTVKEVENESNGGVVDGGSGSPSCI